MQEKISDTIEEVPPVRKPHPKMTDPEEWAIIQKMYFTPKPPDEFGGRKINAKPRQNQAR